MRPQRQSCMTTRTLLFDCWTRSTSSRVLELRDTAATSVLCDECATDCVLVSMTSPQQNPNPVQARNPPPHLALPARQPSPRKTLSSRPSPVTLASVCCSQLLRSGKLLISAVCRSRCSSKDRLDSLRQVARIRPSSASKGHSQPTPQGPPCHCAVFPYLGQEHRHPAVQTSKQVCPHLTRNGLCLSIV